jgi:hypothetical protein
MKNIYKISAIVLISLTMVITSCKKDEQIIEGCTDSSAMNYLSNVTSDNGSCIYAYEIAQGTWYLTPDCQDIDITGIGEISLDTLLPESIIIQGNGGNSLSIDMNGAVIFGEIDASGSVTVAEQDITISSIPFPVTVKGDGEIKSVNLGSIDLTFSAELAGFSLFTSDCDIELTK